jgi:hypothetical protein
MSLIAYPRVQVYADFAGQRLEAGLFGRVRAGGHDHQRPTLGRHRHGPQCEIVALPLHQRADRK